MTRLRFHSAGARVDLVGVDAVDARTAALVVDVAGSMVTEVTEVTEVTDLGSVAVDTVALTRSPEGTRLDGRLLSSDPDFAAASVIGALDRAVLRSTRCLVLHAACVAGPRGAAIVPGASGAGKSTLAAAAMQSGLALLSDEAACLDPRLDVLWPHPRPLGLSGHSRRLLALPTPESGPPDTERATAPALLGASVPVDQPVTPVVVVLVERDGSEQGAPARRGRVTEATAADGLAALLANCLNIGDGAAWTPENAWARLAGLVPSLRVVRLAYGSPAVGAAALSDLLD